jgi:hypothetical protein
MKSRNDGYTLDLPLVGGMLRAQRLVVPLEVVHRLPSYRHACRLAWRLRAIRNMTRAQFAAASGLYASHVTDYLSVSDARRELPARHIPLVERVLGNTVISQWIAQQCDLTVVEEMSARRDWMQRRAA